MLAPRSLRTARSAPQAAPKRLLIIHKPIGTQPEAYDCTGGERDFTLSPILAPFADVREHMVILEGLDIRKKPNTPGEDHGNSIVTFMTGGITYKGDASTLPLAERISIDQMLATHPDIGAATPIRSLQLAADARSLHLFTRVQSYAGRGAPMHPEHRPMAAYARAFGSLVDAGLSAEQLVELRRRKQSVLDFSRSGLARLRDEVGSEDRERLERHVTAIREVELVLDRSLGQVDVAQIEAIARGGDPKFPDEHHAELGRAHLEIVRGAFRCDLTRVVTFGWASGQSFVNFSKLIPGVENIDAHNLSHAGGNIVADETAIHTWYNEQMAELIRVLRDTPDLDGRTLLDNTLVVVWSEMRLGAHTFENVPIQLFGGAGGSLAGGRLLRLGGRPTNDLWLTIARHFGLALDAFGDAERCTGPIDGLFTQV
jgi:hypothetical protein